ncbi:Putative DNA ligase 4 [Monoraphidium neglectum]|uniref:Putative DNA ligase 4 n=1 Tax=Monoraphidium neglectum TaxID=145388 RepID=A0A0D2KAX5_9CHLO|nr:Putative DNA ligase 4 [Monoraphidium neglectum]KIY93113.1 Putative DNA ligase 4 [Monoraphidium neglectum]|eukprot:XP_013892133.1 Putative DNA ligase 4 [Monoraphidium neglectum]
MSLSGPGSAKEKAMLMRWAISNMSPRQCKWLVKIILRDLKVGLSVERVLRDYHPDANKSFNINQDLEKVVNDLADPSTRLIKDVAHPGDTIRHQLCDRKDSVDAVFAAVSGGRAVSPPFVVEIKVDGERIAVHMKGGKLIAMTSRQGFDHHSKSNYDVITPVIPPDIILDGEMIVWNKRRCQFEPFGSLKAVVNAARNGAKGGARIETDSRMGGGDPSWDCPNAEDVEIVFVAFDVLYQTGAGSVTHEPLHKRHDLLRTAVRAAPPEGYPLGPPGCAIRGRVAALLPGQPLLPPCADSDGGASAGGGGGGGGAANAAAATSAGGGGGGYHRDLDASDPGSRILSRVGTNKELIQEMYDLALANNVRQGGSGTDVQALVGV